MDAHPLADAFPMMSDTEYEGLRDDIQKNGVRHGIVVFENKILDGRNRKKATQELGLPCPERRFDPERDGDPAAFVASENIHRRHLTTGQLAMAAEKLATAMAGRPRETGPAGPEGAASTAVKPPTTLEQAAALTGTSATSVKRVRKVRKDGAAPVVAAMEDGRLTPTAADNLVRRPVAEQLQIMETVPAKDLPVVAAAAPVIPITAAVSAAQRGRTGPQAMLERQMDLPDLRQIQAVVKDWAAHQGVIDSLDPDALKRFLAALRRSRTATSQLISLIELKTRTVAVPSPRATTGSVTATVKDA